MQRLTDARWLKCTSGIDLLPLNKNVVTILFISFKS